MMLARCYDSLDAFNFQFSNALSNSGEIRMIKAAFLLDQFTDSAPSMKVVATTSQGKALKIRESKGHGAWSGGLRPPIGQVLRTTTRVK